MNKQSQESIVPAIVRIFEIVEVSRPFGMVERCPEMSRMKPVSDELSPHVDKQEVVAMFRGFGNDVVLHRVNHQIVWPARQSGINRVADPPRKTNRPIIRASRMSSLKIIRSEIHVTPEITAKRIDEQRLTIGKTLT